jgi:hypothetical protein
MANNSEEGEGSQRAVVPVMMTPEDGGVIFLGKVSWFIVLHSV